MLPNYPIQKVPKLLQEVNHNQKPKKGRRKERLRTNETYKYYNGIAWTTAARVSVALKLQRTILCEYFKPSCPLCFNAKDEKETAAKIPRGKSELRIKDAFPVPHSCINRRYWRDSSAW